MGIRKAFVRAGAVSLTSWVLLIAVHFPQDTDQPLSSEEVRKSTEFYRRAYQGASDSASGDSNQHKYEEWARRSYRTFRVKEAVEDFVRAYGLESRRVLEVGAGQGLLQDVVADFTALEISPTARRHFHKPFVLGSATAMPFRDSEFDALWSINVLEHIPNPEQAVSEMRRVVKDQGYIYLRVAWNCEPWLADGYPVRPYSDFGYKGKLIKASIPIRDSAFYRALFLFPIRGLRSLAYYLLPGPIRVHYRKLNANYRDYWMPDSDAVNGIDRQEIYLWFRSRGDRCLNCFPPWQAAFRRTGDGRLIIQVNKETDRR